MADFYPVLKKAIGALPAGADTDRRVAIYEKARSALLRQMEAREPPLSEGEMMRERLALEEVVRRLEREAASEELDALERFADAPIEPSRSSAYPHVAAAAKKRFSRPMIAAAAAAALVVAGGLFALTRPSSTVVATAPEKPADPQPITRSTQPAKPEEPKLQAPVAAAPEPIVQAPEAPKPASGEPAPIKPDPGTQETSNPQETATAEVGKPAAPLAEPAKPLEPPKPADPPAQPETQAPPVTAQAEGKPAETTLLTDSKPTAAIPVAVRASLYEPPLTQGGRATERRGALVWRKTASADAAQTPAISGNFEFPDARLNAVIFIEKNTDKALPATHNVSLLFTPLPGATLGIREVLSIEMRDDLQRLGIRLDGVRAQPVDNMVLIGLSSADPSVTKNIPALREQPWIYVDLIFTDGRRGALIFEKGSTGSKVFDEVFKAWAS